MPNSLSKNVSLLTAASGINGFLKLAKYSVLARLLTPADIGIFALAMAFLSGFSRFSELGFNKIIIEREEVNDNYLSTIWFLQIIRGLILFTFAFFIAPLIADITRNPKVEIVLQIVAFVPAFRGILNPVKLMCERESKFKPIIKFELTENTLLFILIVAFSWYFDSVAGIAIGTSVSVLLSLVTSFIFFSPPKKPIFNKKYAREIISKGKHFVVIVGVGFLMNYADDLIIGSVLGASMLGIYTVAYKLSDSIIQILDKSLSRSILPKLAELKADAQAHSDRFLELFKMQIAVLVPLSFGIYYWADPIILLFFGVKFMEAIPVLKVFSIIIFFRAFGYVVAPFLFSKGAFSYLSKIKIWEALVYAGGLVVGIYVFGGLVEAVIGISLGFFTAAISRVIYFRKYHERLNRKMMNFIIKLVLATSICMIPSVILQNLLGDSYFIYFCTALLFTLIYAGYLYFFQKNLIKGLLTFNNKRLNKKT